MDPNPLKDILRGIAIFVIIISLSAAASTLAQFEQGQHLEVFIIWISTRISRPSAW